MSAIYSSLKIYERGRFQLETDRNSYLERCVSGKSVLHVGCSDHPIAEQRIKEQSLLHLRLQRGAREVIGIDLSAEGINILKSHGIRDVMVMDAENIELPNKFDLIMAGDVLEHMNNPGRFLESAIKRLSPNGEIVIGVPSALTLNNIKAWLGGWEQVHRDHTFYFSPKTLATLCARYGLLPTKLVFTVQSASGTESGLFVFIRQTILKLCKPMAPSIVMHFKKADEVDKSAYAVWQ